MIKTEKIGLYEFIRAVLEEEVKERYGTYTENLKFEYIRKTGRNLGVIKSEISEGKAFIFQGGENLE
ncbi:hypothetical protein [Dethiothermospora halolimnae]|uniref:hypothetical protein n=1 Tax=Dethiothermospora halolimnae TaxID=3114390 RepID=UPI003CCBF56B